MTACFFRPIALLLGGVIFSTVVSASPLTINFENYSSTAVLASACSGGFDFTPAAGLIAVSANGANCAPMCAANGTTALVVGGTGLNPPTVAPVTMSTGLFASFRLAGLTMPN